MTFIPPRVDTPELLDLGGEAPAEVQRSLRDLERINRWLGGNAAITAHLYPRLRTAGGSVTVADVATGSAHLPHAISAWARQHGRDVRLFALDFSARHLEYAAAAPTTQLVQADALSLPFAPLGVDYYVSSLFLHHLPPDSVIAFLGDTYARARRGIIMSDLIRGWLPLIGFKLIQPAFACSYITRYEAIASIKRGYLPAELRAMARQAGIPQPRIYGHPLFRMTLVADKC